MISACPPGHPFHCPHRSRQIFKKQIAAGGPVTVTHPEMRRFFMTIPEAAQLVLQASTMGQGGEIFVLDMGEPVRIVDLATNLILLSGLQPGRDIKIEFTGVRPGEKLYEEINSFEENTLPTYHESIKIFSGSDAAFHDLDARLETLRALCAARDERDLLLHLKNLIPDYNPSAGFLQRVLGSREKTFAAHACPPTCPRLFFSPPPPRGVTALPCVSPSPRRPIPAGRSPVGPRGTNRY